MEYEFRRNSLDGTLTALFSLEHEVMGRWFAEELGDDQARLALVLEVIAELLNRQRQPWRLSGREFSLELDDEQARVYANVLDIQHDDELDEGLSLYDDALEASCGLEDFQTALLSWQAFLADSR